MTDTGILTFAIFAAAVLYSLVWSCPRLRLRRCHGAVPRSYGHEAYKAIAGVTVILARR